MRKGKNIVYNYFSRKTLFLRELCFGMCFYDNYAQ